jgi:hypothetical protein
MSKILEVLLTLDGFKITPCASFSNAIHIEKAEDRTARHSNPIDRFFTCTYPSLTFGVNKYTYIRKSCRNHLPIFLYLVKKFPETWWEVTEENYH